MQLSISLANHSWSGGPEVIGNRVSRLVRQADQAGIDTLWAMDHMFQIPMNGPPTDPLLEAYALIGFAAGHTERLRLGALVTSVAYRHPGLLIKTLTALDVLTQGRIWLGIGASWHEEEARAFGIPFPRLSERFERLEETLQIAHRMWEGDRNSDVPPRATPFHGTHYQLDNPVNSPSAIQRPHPPILVGGSGERKTLRLVAQYADACNLFDIPEGVEVAGIRGGLGLLRHKLEVLRGHCEQVGRPYEDIEKTAVSTIAISSDEGEMKGSGEILDHLGNLASVGIQHVIVEPSRRPWDEASLELVGSLVAEAAELAA